MKQIKAIIIALTIVILAITAFISLFAWSCNSPAVPLEKLNQLQVGMTKTQVQAVLGNPDEETSTSDFPGSHWWYKKPYKWYALRIDFTEDGKVIRYIHDD